MYLDKLNPNLISQGMYGMDPFEATQQLGSQGMQNGFQTKNKVEGAKQNAMQNHQQMMQQQQQAGGDLFSSLANVGLAFATGGTSAGLGALAGEAIGGPVGDIVGMAVGKGVGKGAADTASNALTDISGSELANYASDIPGVDYLDFTGQRNRWF